MSKNLVIVESPAKAKTIEKYLGKEYKVLASYGHVRDLVSKTGAVDPDAGFTMKYEMIERNEKHVEKIVKALKKADTLLLATDPDREGEAISWHLVEHLRNEGHLDGKQVQRVVFYEITKSAIQEAIQHPRDLGQELINAQQARRALDHLVGFNLSPLLWKKISRGLSAGRVQSPALRMICEREDEIEAFVPREYWTINANLEKDAQPFNGRLLTLAGEKVQQFTITDEQAASDAKSALLNASGGQVVASKVVKKQRKRNPAAPFTTSTLQQEASRKLGFGAQRTMRIAQQLYEGVDIGEGQIGLITYMRTDSITLSQDCLDELREMIPQRYGSDYLPAEINVYKNKSKNAQEAHEAVRPSSVKRIPDDIKAHLDNDQYRLYNLIWQRTVASQMIHATLDQVAVDLDCGDAGQFRANGSTLRFEGFMKIYREGQDDKKSAEDEDNRMLPEIEEGDRIPLLDVITDQHFTEPPPRYSEASLVKSLEEYGIGRPSTYASIISTLQSRKYVEIESRRFFPTDTGRVVSRFLSDSFTKYVDYDFTANLEDELDAISRGETDWLKVLEDFWTPFSDDVEKGDDGVRIQRLIGTDPESGRPVSVRVGQYGAYAQIGTKEDEEKPKWAGLRPGQKLHQISLEEALQLFDLPRQLGETEDGEKVSANIGRFGPYVRYGSKFVSLKEDDPYTVTLERALVLIKEKIAADAAKLIKTFEVGDTTIQILHGRWGPYITDGNKNARVPKEMKETPEQLDLETCLKLLEEAPEKRGRGKKKAAAKADESGTKKTASKKKSAGKKKARAKKKAAAKKSSARKKAKAKTGASASKKKTSAKRKVAGASRRVTVRPADGND